MNLVEACVFFFRPPPVLSRMSVDGLPQRRGRPRGAGHAPAQRALRQLGAAGGQHALTRWPLSVVVRPLDSRRSIDSILSASGSRSGVELIAKRRGLRESAGGAPARPAWSGILLDQNASRREGVFVPVLRDSRLDLAGPRADLAAQRARRWSRCSSGGSPTAATASRSGAPVPRADRRRRRGLHRGVQPGDRGGDPAGARAVVLAAPSGGRRVRWSSGMETSRRAGRRRQPRGRGDRRTRGGPPRPPLLDAEAARMLVAPYLTRARGAWSATIDGRGPGEPRTPTGPPRRSPTSW